MAAPMTDTRMDTRGERVEEMCEIEATVATGFEWVAKEEAEEKLGAETRIGRGKIIIQMPVVDVRKVLDLGCIDNCRVIMSLVPDFQFSDDELESMRRLRELVKDTDWVKGLLAWKQIFSFELPIIDKPEVIPESLGEPTLSSRVHRIQKDPNAPSRHSKTKGKRKRQRPNAQGCNLADLQKTEGRVQEGEVTSLHSAINSQQDSSNSLTGNAGTNSSKSRQADEQETVLTGNARTNSSQTRPADKQETVPVDKVDNADPVVALSESDTIVSEKRKPESVPQTMPNEDVTKKPRVRENPWNPKMPAFRVTCNRSGEGHSFDSMGAASNFGGAIYNYFGWNVDMKNFDIEVILNIEGNEVSVCIGLTKQSLHFRNITSFGPTTLRPTVAYNMLRLCRIQPGDVVCDPMCGSGSIPIQAAVSWPEAIHICGEIHPRTLSRTVENMTSLNEARLQEDRKRLDLDCLRWDVFNLPLRDNTVDVFVTDLPFGRRVGHKADNWQLYPGALTEMARVAKRGTGRLCVLTQDKKCIFNTVQKLHKYWRKKWILGINLGGLAAVVLHLSRTGEPVSRDHPPVSSFQASPTGGDQEEEISDTR